MTDPRFTDPRLSDPMIRRDEWTSGRDENVGGMWSWVAGVSLLLLIGFLIFAGWNSNSNTANSSSSPPTTTASRTVTPPSTTGSGSSSPQPITPAPSKSGTQ
jgi:ABC-type phosphate transport system substrate-binding protein